MLEYLNIHLKNAQIIEEKYTRRFLKLGSQVPKGMEAVYMRISISMKKKWRLLAKEHNTDMTNYFLTWLEKQKVKD